jgi:hypothetical protein
LKWFSGIGPAAMDDKFLYGARFRRFPSLSDDILRVDDCGFAMTETQFMPEFSIFL